MNEIEDVVSSVRRLVSPEARPRPLSRDLGLEKLVLTPALRVVPDAKEATGTIANSKAKATATHEGEGTAEAFSAEPIRVMPAGPVDEAEWEAPFWTEPEPALAEMALQAEDAVVVTSPEFETIAAPVPKARKPATVRKSPAKTATAVKSTLKTATAVKSTLKTVKPAPKPRKTATKPAPVAAKPVLELVRSDPDVTQAVPLMLVPDAVGDEVTASLLDLGTDLPVKTETQAEPMAPIGIEEDLVVNGLAQILTDRDGNPVSLLDEAELILMVRRVIREELQDVLGERITRNVRKLVRAEINRALTSQTLE